MNAEMTALMSAYLNLTPDMAAADSIREISESCHVSMEYAYAEYLAAVCGLDTGGMERERDKDFFRNYFQEAFHCLSAADFTGDPFYRLLSPAIGEGKRSGKWELRMQRLAPGEAFVCGDFLVTEDKRMIPQIGFFIEPYDYPAILENGREWMTLLPNETITTLPAVAQATGKVLTYGLGLGYFAFMTARKQEVSAVTVVERSEDAAALFAREIYPLFPEAVARKITVVRDDAFHYAEHTASKERFDFIFTDIWHDVGDGRELYLRMKETEKFSPDSRFAYWLEDSIRCYLDDSLWPEKKEEEA